MKRILLVLLALTACKTAPPTVAPTPTPAPVVVATPAPTPVVANPVAVEKLKQIAASSSCSRISFVKHGHPRKGWLKGTAIVYARAICNPNRPEVKAASVPPGSNDAISYYGLGGNTLRNTYALMVGLAARESEWKYCCGRDMGSDFKTADSAEGGFLQTSYGARMGKDGVLRANGAINDLYLKWKASDKSKCLLAEYKEGVDPDDCDGGNAKNWGTGEGVEWQKLSKTCPAFAAEYGALVMRYNAGARGEFGPIRTKAAEFHSECADMFKMIEDFVAVNPSVCNSL